MNKEEKQILLAKAEADYPAGTKFYSAISGIEATSEGDFVVTPEGDITTFRRTVYNGYTKQWAVKVGR